MVDHSKRSRGLLHNEWIWLVCNWSSYGWAHRLPALVILDRHWDSCLGGADSSLSGLESIADFHQGSLVPTLYKFSLSYNHMLCEFLHASSIWLTLRTVALSPLSFSLASSATKSSMIFFQHLLQKVFGLLPGFSASLSPKEDGSLLRHSGWNQNWKQWTLEPVFASAVGIHSIRLWNGRSQAVPRKAAWR